MSLPLTVFISGISGVFLVMIFLLIMITLSSKLVISIEKKQESAKQKLEG